MYNSYQTPKKLLTFSIILKIYYIYPWSWRQSKGPENPTLKTQTLQWARADKKNISNDTQGSLIDNESNLYVIIYLSSTVCALQTHTSYCDYSHVE